MAQFFYDTFTDANGTGLAAHTPDVGTGWAANSSWNGGAVGAIQNNAHYGGITNCVWYCDAAPSSTADYRVIIDTSVQAFGGNFLGAWAGVRLGTTTQDGYFLQVRDNGGFQIILFKVVSGSTTTLNTVTPGGTYGDCKAIIECEGTAIRCKVQRASDGQWATSGGSWSATEQFVINTTDSSLAGPGRPGLNATNSLSTTRTHITTFEAETLTTVFTESVTSTLNFVQDGYKGSQEQVEEDLILASEIIWFNVEDDREVPESVLNLTQTVELSGLIRGISNELEFVSTATAFLLGENIVSSTLNLTQQVEVVFGVPHSAPWGVANIEHVLELEQDWSREAPINASNTLSFTQEAIVSYGFESVLNLTQTVSGGIGYGIEHELGLSHTLSSAGSIWNRSASHTIPFTSSGNGFNGNDKCFRRVGEASGPTQTGDLTLYSKDGLYSVTLRNPEIDNIRRTAFDRVVRETRGGNLIVYRDPNWNVVQTLLFTIVALKRSTLDSLQTFFLNTLGQEIALVDWLGEEWSGVVTRPDETVTEDRDGYWTFAFEFEGTKVDSDGVYQNLNLTHSATAVVV